MRERRRGSPPTTRPPPRRRPHPPPPPPPAPAGENTPAGGLACLAGQGIIGFSAEKSRVEKEMARVKSDIARIDAKLANADFVGRAPEEVVEGEREKREEAETRRLKIDEA